MSVSKRVVLWAMVAFNIIVVMILSIGAAGRKSGPASCVTVPSPEGTVESFFSALADRDFHAADGMIANYTSLGIPDALPSGTDALSAYIYDNLFDSYEIAPVSGAAAEAQDGGVSSSDLHGRAVIPAELYEVSGSRANVEILFTGLDETKISARLTKLLRSIGKKNAEKGVAVDNDKTALKLFNQSIKSLKKDNIAKYRSTVRLNIELIYTEGQWKIVLSPELYNALTGRFYSGSDDGTSALDTGTEGGSNE